MSVTLDIPRKKQLFQEITDALRQMSYYYGVNLSWGICGNLSKSADRNTATDYTSISHDFYSGTAFYLNKVSVIEEGGEFVLKYTDGKNGWSVPEYFHAAYPHDRMWCV